MNRAVDAESQQDSQDRYFPAYGLIEAGLGYIIFYVLIDRVTPAVVRIFSDTVLNISPSLVRLSLAIVLWFVLVVSTIDQARRQLAALGIGQTVNSQLRVWSRVRPASLRTAGYLLAVVVGFAVAAMTFETAVEALLSLIPIVASLDVGQFEILELVEMFVFFIAYSVGAHSLDRLVIGSLRGFHKSE